MGMYNSQVIVSVSIPSILIVFTYVFKMMIFLVCAADRRSVGESAAFSVPMLQIAIFSRLQCFRDYCIRACFLFQ